MRGCIYFKATMALVALINPIMGIVIFIFNASRGTRLCQAGAFLTPNPLVNSKPATKPKPNEKPKPVARSFLFNIGSI